MRPHTTAGPAAPQVSDLEHQVTRHRQVEERLRQSEERFRLLVERGGEVIFRFNFNPLRCEYISPSIVDLCGYSASEFYDNPNLVLDVVHTDDRPLLKQYITAQDYTRTLALRCIRRGGEVALLEQRTLPSYDTSGRLVCLEGVVRDVSSFQHLLEDSDQVSERSVEDREQMQSALPQIGSATLNSLELDNVLETISHQIVHAGILRNLMVALVDEQSQTVRVCRNYMSFDGNYEDGVGQVRPGARITPSPTVARRDGGRLVFSDQRIIGTTYDLDDENITPTVARTGQFTVIDGADKRFDERFEHDDDAVRSQSFAYFIPIQREGRVLAVLATGSTVAKRDDTLQCIKAMEPLFEQVAIALDHAMAHSRVQDHARELQTLNGRLREEISGRLRAEAALKDFSQHTVHLAEEERRRVARELHDGVNQLLCAVGFGLEAAGRDSSSEIREGLERTRELVGQTIREVRRISQDLRPGVLDDLGLAPAVRSLCDTFAERTGVTIAYDLEQVPGDLGTEVAITSYRLLQESLHQWEQASAARELHVEIRDEDDNLLCELRADDDLGNSLTPNIVQHMHERARLLSGSVSIGPAPVDGTRLLIRMPISLPT